METFGVRLQVLEWLLALSALYFFCVPRKAHRFDLDHSKANEIIFRLLIGYFALALLVKCSQYFSLQLNAQDFWLFADMLETGLKRQWGVTHFAPQSWGPMQQGVIHPFIPWLALVPVSALFGSTVISLVFHPACLVLAAMILDRLGKHLRISGTSRFLVLMAFLLSRQVSLTMMYEVHPEAIYPLLTFGMALAILKERWFLASLWGVGLGILKEDSFMVVWGVFFTVLVFNRSLIILKWRKAAIPFIASACAYLIQVGLIRYFSIHPGVGEIPTAGVLIGNNKWDSLSGILQTAEALLAANGGLSGAIKNFLSFLISDSWRGILFAAPWVAFSPGFWISELPLALSFSLRGANAVFWNYYSIPFIAFFWIFVLKSLKGKNSIRWPLIVLVLSLLNGSEGMVLSIPSPKLLQFRSQALEFQPIIEHVKGEGVVLARLLPFVPLSRVVSDRLPESIASEARVSFYFLTKNHTSWNIPIEVLNAKIDYLRGAGSGFVVAKETSEAILFTRLR